MLRLIAMTMLAFATLAARAEPITIGESQTIQSDTLGQTRRINIYLPPGYADGKQAYPVLYLLDGGVQEDYLHIAGIATLAADWRGIRDFILVGIEGIDRYHDMTAPSDMPDDLKRLPTSGGAATFRRFLAEELVPHIKATYRVTDETVLMGESMAGLFVAETFIETPALFEGYVAISPSLWWNDQALAKSAATRLANPVFPKARRLFLTMAGEGGPMQDGFDRLVAAIRATPQTGTHLTVAPMDGETHATTLHPAALRAVRQFFAYVE